MERLEEALRDLERRTSEIEKRLGISRPASQPPRVASQPSPSAQSAKIPRPQGPAAAARAEESKELASGTGSFFGVIGIVMKAAPLGAFGAMAYTIGKFGPAALGNLIGLIALFYTTAFLFVVIVLGLIARRVGFSIFRFIAYIKDSC